MVAQLFDNFHVEKSFVEELGGDHFPHFGSLSGGAYGVVVHGEQVLVDAADVVDRFHGGGRHLELHPVVQRIAPHALLLHIGVELSLGLRMRVRYAIS